MIRNMLPVLVVGLLVTSCGDPPNAATPSLARSAEDVVRSLFVAMLTNDEVGVRQAIVAHADAEILWQGETPPPGMLAAARSEFEQMTCRECQAGETIDIGGGQAMRIPAEYVTADAKALWPMVADKPLTPTPLRVLRVAGEWKVDASPLIGARLAAKRVRGY